MSSARGVAAQPQRRLDDIQRTTLPQSAATYSASGAAEAARTNADGAEKKALLHVARGMLLPVTGVVEQTAACDEQ